MTDLIRRCDAVAVLQAKLDHERKHGPEGEYPLANDITQMIKEILELPSWEEKGASQ